MSVTRLTARDARRPLVPEAIRWDASGLVPAVVQDAGDGEVLMVGYLDREALEATLSSGDAHFHSRSRDRLWRKGETSGNMLRVRELALDCDGDTVLMQVDPTGPTCHTGARSCFDLEPDGPEAKAADRPDAGTQGFAWLEELWATIAQRAADRPAGSYTAELIAGGVDAVSRKLIEEATEVVLAAKDTAGPSDAIGRSDPSSRKDALAGELADLLYHALVLSAERELEPRDFLRTLRSRAGQPTDRRSTR
jgi:phosphoribosyl-ATP pyrophosphohydrolase/phosphoribosyl-AMP cyclohydrolase